MLVCESLANFPDGDMILAATFVISITSAGLITLCILRFPIVTIAVRAQAAIVLHPIVLISYNSHEHNVILSYDTVIIVVIVIVIFCTLKII